MVKCFFHVLYAERDQTEKRWATNSADSEARVPLKLRLLFGAHSRSVLLALGAGEILGSVDFY